MNSSSGNPFVGLRPFESDESLLFFGRQHQVLELLQRLHQHHFVAVTGSSGSGKSSLIKAGLIPRLKAGFLVDDRSRWIIASAKPGQSPVCNLADSILTPLAYTGHNLSATDVQEKIKTKGVDVILDILKPLWKSNTNFFLLIDQFEELFRFSLNDSNVDKRDEAIDFVNILLQLADHVELPVYIVLTMRSDFIGDCSQFYGLPEAMNQSQYIVPRLNRVQLETTIEAPVRLYDAKIDSALIARLLNDIQTVKDELPLLQHALMRLWDHKKNIDPDGELTIPDYESIGGIERALCNHADEALQGMPDAELALTRKIFQALTAVDQNGRKIRRPAHLSELQAITGAGKEALLNIINRFIEDNRSFLVINRSSDNTDLLIDISHESLIRQWNVLNTWVDEEAESAGVFLRLTESAALYTERKKDLLSGNELQQFLEWYKSAKPDIAWAQRYNSSYQNNVKYLTQSEIEYTRQKAIKRRNRQLFISALFFIIMIISGFAFFIYKNNIDNKNKLALNYWKSSQLAKAGNNYLDALHLLIEAAVITNDKTLLQNVLIDAEASLPHTALNAIFPQDDIITGVSFSADGKVILVAGNNGNARLLDKASGKLIGQNIKHSGPVTSAAFSTDNKMIITVAGDHKAYVWNAADGKQLHVFNHEEDVTCAGLSPDAQLVVTGSTDGYVRLWQTGSGNQIDSIKQKDEINNAVFSPDGSGILISSGGNTPYLWDVTIKKEVEFLSSSSESSGIITNAIYSLDGAKILTIGNDSTVRIWDKNATLLATLKHDDRVTDAVFSPNGKWILTASDNNTVRLWNFETQIQAGAAMKHDGPVYSVSFSNDGKQIVTAGWDKTIRIWDVEPMEDVTKISAFKHQGIVTTALFNTDGTKILTAGYDSTARLWDRKTMQQLQSFKHRGKINSAVFNSDGSRIVTAGDDSTVRTWETATGKPLDILKLNDKIHKAIYSADEKKLLTAGYDNYIIIWDAAEQPMTLIDSFKFNAEISDAVFSHDGKNILIAAGDSAAHIVQAASRKTLMSFKHGDMVSNAVFNNNENKVLTASWDRTARAWNVATGQQLGPSMTHTTEVKSAAFSTDEKWIVTTAFDKTVHLWNTATLKEIGIGKNHSAPLNSAVFSPDNRWILTAGYDSTAELQEIEGDLDLPPSLFMLQAKAITGVEYNIETNESQCIPAEEWLTVKRDYQEQAEEHYKTCKFPQYNLWARFSKSAAAKHN